MITGESDDHVFPAHSYKFVAALQAVQRGPQPIVLATMPGAGHQLLDQAGRTATNNALQLEFLTRYLDMGEKSVAA